MVGLAVEDGESDPTGQIEREREKKGWEATTRSRPDQVKTGCSQSASSPSQVRDARRHTDTCGSSWTRVLAGQWLFRRIDQHLQKRAVRSYKTEDGGSSPSAPTANRLVSGLFLALQRRVRSRSSSEVRTRSKSSCRVQWKCELRLGGGGGHVGFRGYEREMSWSGATVPERRCPPSSSSPCFTSPSSQSSSAFKRMSWRVFSWRAADAATQWRLDVSDAVEAQSPYQVASTGHATVPLADSFSLRGCSP
jgi:hypothetical protein